MRVSRRIWLLAAAAASLVVFPGLGLGAAKPPTKIVPVKSPDPGNMSISHFVLTAKTKAASKHPPTFKVSNVAKLGSDAFVVANVKKGKPVKGRAHYDVTVVVAVKSPSPGPIAGSDTRPDSARELPPVQVAVTGPYAETGFAGAYNTVGLNPAPTAFTCDAKAPASSWYRGMGWGGVNPQDAYAFGCDTAFDQPGPVGFATTLGALYCAISDVYFDSSKTEHITKIEACTFPVKGFEARTSSGTKIINNLPPQGFTCTVKVTAYDCFDPLGVPIGTLIVWNLDFEGVLPENTEIEVELSTDGTSFQPKLTFGVPAAGINYRGGG